MRVIIVSGPVQNIEGYRQYSVLANSIDGFLVLLNEAVIKTEIGYGFQLPLSPPQPAQHLKSSSSSTISTNKRMRSPSIGLFYDQRKLPFWLQRLSLPSTSRTYIHRISRTARIGNAGLATSFFNDRNEDIADDLVYAHIDSKQQFPDYLENRIPAGNAVAAK